MPPRTGAIGGHPTGGHGESSGSPLSLWNGERITSNIQPRTPNVKCSEPLFPVNPRLQPSVAHRLFQKLAVAFGLVGIRNQEIDDGFLVLVALHTLRRYYTCHRTV